MPVNDRPPPAPTTAVLLCNLGTPDAPTPAAVRRYLAEFLGDPRVVEIPRLAWWPILHGLILPLRSRQSAAKYQTVWMPEGSPLKVWTERQAKRLQGWLGERGLPVRVGYAMRYGTPGIAGELDKLVSAGVQRIVLLSAYPQYSCTTTASLVDAVGEWSRRQRSLPELRFVNRYHDDRGYLRALAQRIERDWQANGRPDHLVMSFHGVPERTRELGDPYHDQCQATGRLLAEWLQLAPSQYTVSFQSRFGKAKWLQPYTQPTVERLAREGTRRLDIVCPGFIADCLETLEEIAMENRDAFLDNGGQEFHYIPCLNADDAWIGALGEIARRNLAGWVDAPAPGAPR